MSDIKTGEDGGENGPVSANISGILQNKYRECGGMVSEEGVNASGMRKKAEREKHHAREVEIGHIHVKPM